MVASNANIISSHTNLVKQRLVKQFILIFLITIIYFGGLFHGLYLGQQAETVAIEPAQTNVKTLLFNANGTFIYKNSTDHRYWVDKIFSKNDIIEINWTLTIIDHIVPVIRTSFIQGDKDYFIIWDDHVGIGNGSRTVEILLDSMQSVFALGCYQFCGGNYTYHIQVWRNNLYLLE